MSSELVSQVSRFLEQHAPGLVAAFVYGSVATGHAGPGSDIDCFVMLDNLPDPGTREQLRVGFGRLQTALGYTPDLNYPIEVFSVEQCLAALSSATTHRALGQACSQAALCEDLAETDAVEVLRAMLGTRLTVRSAPQLDDLTRLAQELLAEASGHTVLAPDRDVLRALGVRSDSPTSERTTKWTVTSSR
ncbi:nucleotidyltransferase domain-containing protein [Kitasatospora sp. NPDC127116]|uniref:nucleotidyltransferase domain-containing protein n=1 Tax=Kitasatospora sp. NPDC127116 TaxID=3345367 RepID=UPI00363C9B23